MPVKKKTPLTLANERVKKAKFLVKKYTSDLTKSEKKFSISIEEEESTTLKNLQKNVSMLPKKHI